MATNLGFSASWGYPVRAAAEPIRVWLSAACRTSPRHTARCRDTVLVTTPGAPVTGILIARRQ